MTKRKRQSIQSISRQLNGLKAVGPMGRCGRHKKWHIILRLSPGRTPQIKVGDKAETIEIPYKELYIGEVEDMADAVLERKEPRMSLANSRDIIDMIVGLVESERMGKAITR